MINIVGATHPGIRNHNEDSFAADSECGIGLVADGMGGYACGEVASELVKHTVMRALYNNEGLKEAIGRAHSVVKAAGENDTNKKGMGSTVIALKMIDSDYDIAWVGDSRAYLWNGALNQITRDHSYVERLLAAGEITYSEAINHPNRNLITQAIGVTGEQGLEISMIHGRLVAGQQLLLCSDGLVDEVVDGDIARIMSEATSPAEMVNNLISAAVVAGGRDNITVLIASAGDEYREKAAILPNFIRSVRVPEKKSDVKVKEKKNVDVLGGSIIKKEEPSNTAEPPTITKLDIMDTQSDAKSNIAFSHQSPGIFTSLKNHYQIIIISTVVASVVAGALLFLS